MRGYVIEREDCEDCERENNRCIRCEVREKMVRELAAKWNIANSRDEERRWGMTREQREEEQEYWGERFAEEACDEIEKAHGSSVLAAMSKAEYEALEAPIIARKWEEHDRQANRAAYERDAAEELLAELGARMMRRFEHMNEEESYHEMMESRAEARASASGEWDY